MPRHRSQSRSRKYKGGSGNYTSASSYGSYVNGTGDAQFSRTFDTTGQFANRIGAEYVGAQGQNSQQFGTPTEQNLSLVQSAGRRSKRSRSKRGGIWGQVINQAIVPLSLLAMQQTYRRKKNGGRKTRKTRRSRR
jgi:hypothetical protein